VELEPAFGSGLADSLKDFVEKCIALRHGSKTWKRRDIGLVNAASIGQTLQSHIFGNGIVGNQ
jgi:hypothetical protein